MTDLTALADELEALRAARNKAKRVGDVREAQRRLEAHLVIHSATIVDALRREAKMREALKDVEEVFAYLEADIEIDMADGEDDSAPLPCVEAMALCGHNMCVNTGCVSLRLASIRAALGGSDA